MRVAAINYSVSVLHFPACYQLFMSPELLFSVVILLVLMDFPVLFLMGILLQLFLSHELLFSVVLVQVLTDVCYFLDGSSGSEHIY